MVREKPGHFRRMATARKMYAWISEQIGYGKRVMICTYGRCPIHSRIEDFRLSASETDVYVRRGKSWDCISFSKLDAID